VNGRGLENPAPVAALFGVFGTIRLIAIFGSMPHAMIGCTQWFQQAQKSSFTLASYQGVALYDKCTDEYAANPTPLHDRAYINKPSRGAARLLPGLYDHPPL